jgi:uncharacterized membrane protein
MDVIQVVLAIAAIAAGGFAGLIAAMVGVIQRMLNGLEYREYRLAMQGIIVSGRKSGVVLALMLTPILASAAALVMLWGQRAGPAFTLTAAGLAAFLLGPVLVSRRLCEPLYDHIMAWTADQAPEGWQQARMRWFNFNLARLGIGGAACALITLALAVVE